MSSNSALSDNCPTKEETSGGQWSAAVSDCINCHTINKTNPKTLSHSSTITDICNNRVGDEVELLTLVEEQIPRYRLRYDTITQFSGYDNNDWYIKTPVLDADTDIDLSPETLNETLKYLVLSSERLSQMTKTYNDIEVVTKLLEEKERDLELAARIGQSLLEQNQILTTRNEELEADLTASSESVEKLKFEVINASERVIQLKHELSMKNGLLQVYCADIEEHDIETEAEEQVSDERTSILANWEELHKRVNNLEEENLRMKCEAMTRANDIELEEKKELQLIQDCAKQLTEANLQILNFQEEVGRKNEDNVRQQEEITNLISQVVELQRKAKELAAENESLQNALQVSQECQNELSLELIEIKEKYGTLLAAFHELQTEFKKRSRIQSSHYTFMPYSESLASEIESTLGSDGSEEPLSLGSNFAVDNRQPKKKSLNNKDDLRCYSPDSVLSGESFYYRYNNPQPMINFAQNKNFYLLPDKLRIVKPLEGSATLRQWQKLATPHLGVILESLPGVPNKAVKDLNKELLDFTAKVTKQGIDVTTAGPVISGQLNSVTTKSIFTYTTTSLSQTTESTSVTPSFSKVQLSTGRDSPIVSTCLVLTSQSETLTTAPALNEARTDKCIFKGDSLGLEALILGDSNTKIVKTDLPSDCETKTARLNPCNNNQTASGSKSPEHSGPKHSVNATNCSEKGLGGMSALLGMGSGSGIIFKCNSLSLKPKPTPISRPNSLSIQMPPKTCDRSEVSDLSLMKTLRKGGFV